MQLVFLFFIYVSPLLSASPANAHRQWHPQCRLLPPFHAACGSAPSARLPREEQVEVLERSPFQSLSFFQRSILSKHTFEHAAALLKIFPLKLFCPSRKLQFLIMLNNLSFPFWPHSYPPCTLCVSHAELPGVQAPGFLFHMFVPLNVLVFLLEIPFSLCSAGRFLPQRAGQCVSLVTSLPQ